MINQDRDAKSERLKSADLVEGLSATTSFQRIELLDIIRGVALIGIILMNIEWFNRPTGEIGSFDKTLLGLDHTIGWLVRCFVEAKFYKLFALLFGMGFAIMLIRAQRRGKPFFAWLTRRMVSLFIIGMLHMVLIWNVDILHDYAFAGLAFLGIICLLGHKHFEKYNKPQFLLKLGLSWLFIGYATALIVFMWVGAGKDFNTHDAEWQKDLRIMRQIESLELSGSALADEGQIKPIGVHDQTSINDSDDGDVSEEMKLAQEKIEERFEDDKVRSEEIKVMKEGSYLQATQFRLKGAIASLSGMLPFSFFILLPIFLLGYWLVSSNIIKEHEQHKSLFKSMAWVGLGFGLAFTISGLLVMQHPIANDVSLFSFIGMILFDLGSYIMTAGYLGLIICMMNVHRCQQALRKLIPLGRMALTNYIMHSIILSCIFYGYAGGMYGQLSKMQQILIVFIIIAFQVNFSKWWLKSYRFGPLEWMWRSISFMRLQVFKVSVGS